MTAFSAPALAIHAMGLPLTIYLPEYYANALGLNLTAVGAAFMSVRLLDMAFDPILGGMMDRTRSRWGRFRPWLAVSAPILMLSMAMLFLASPGVGLGYLWGWLLVGFAGYSMIVLSHLSWAATLTSDPRARTRIFAWWQIFANAGQLGILLAPAAVAWMTAGDAVASIHAIGWLLLFIIPLSILSALLSTREEAVPATVKPRSFLRDYLGLFRRPLILRLLAADLFIGLSLGIAGAVALFFYTGPMQFPRDVAGVIVMTSYVTALIGVPIFACIANRIGKSQVMVVGAICLCGLQMMLLILPAKQFPLAILLASANGLCLPIALFLPRAIMADVAEADRVATGMDQTGLLFALLNGTMKLALGLAVGAAFLLLDWLGFDPAQPAADTAAVSLRIAAGGVPAILTLVVALCMWRFPLARAPAPPSNS